MKHINFILIRYSFILIIGVINFTPFYASSQNNLIKNPSCEDALQIPDNLAQYSFCNAWWKPYIWTTDYYTNNTLSTNNNFIPQNTFGYQTNVDGEYYLGGSLLDWIYDWNDYNTFRHDFVAGQFENFLEKDKIYQFEFWISKAEKGLIRSNAFDVVITYDTIIDVNNFTAYGYKIWSEKTPMSDTINWVKISTCFRAKGNEKAFAIGNFHEKTEVILEFPSNPSPTGDIDYRYLDNFSLIECPTCCPDQFPDEEQVNVYSNPSSDGNPASLQVWLHPNTSGELRIFDSAGRLVEKLSYAALENIFVFQNYAEGMYHYVLSTSDGELESGKVLVEN